MHELHHASGLRAGETYLICWFWFGVSSTDTEEAGKADQLLSKSLIFPNSSSNPNLQMTKKKLSWAAALSRWTRLCETTFPILLVPSCQAITWPCILLQGWAALYPCPCLQARQVTMLWENTCKPSWTEVGWGSPILLLGCAPMWLWSRQRSLVGEQCDGDIFIYGCGLCDYASVFGKCHHGYLNLLEKGTAMNLAERK